MRPEETLCQEPIRDNGPDRYKPSADEIRRRHQINIEFLDSGCIVRIGCKSIAFTNYQSAMSELNTYVKDPIEAYKKWSKDLNVELY